MPGQVVMVSLRDFGLGKLGACLLTASCQKSDATNSRS